MDVELIPLSKWFWYVFGLTVRQENVLLFIVEFRAKHGWSPSYAEIGNRFGFRSSNGVVSHLRSMERKGAIRLDAFLARSIVPCIKFIPARNL
jgi:SOS-response transcriptional repressor LexA